MGILGKDGKYVIHAIFCFVFLTKDLYSKILFKLNMVSIGEIKKKK